MQKKVIAALALAVLLAGCSGKPQLTLCTQGDMFPREILRGFRKETGIRVKLVRVDSLHSGEGFRPYDLVIADDYAADYFIREGLARKIDRTRLSNYNNINPMYQNPYYDPGNEYTIPCGAGIQTIVYSPQKTSAIIEEYYDLWNPELEKRVGIVDNYRVINGIALKVMGASANTENIFQIDMAGILLFQLAPNIRIISDDKLPIALRSGEIFAAVMYTNQVNAAKLAQPELEVVFPADGIAFSVKPAFIPNDSPNAEAALAFLDYIMEPQRGARCFEHSLYYCTFSASDALIKSKYRGLITYPEHLQGRPMEIHNIRGEAEGMHEMLWGQFKEAATGGKQRP